MKKRICEICHKNNVYSKYNSCCSDCAYKIKGTINTYISNEKANIGHFLSEKKSKFNKDKYYYDKDKLYYEIKESNEYLNFTINRYANIIKFDKGILEYIELSNKRMKEIEEIHALKKEE